eukprot:CAMPEP_0180693712 /NCGR_PEP_ID=MMETSP1038_2-20121128/1509_1 /TAXON_ID=632150 /ORGANISM="Azadinium spinosum, Strain 3D9" /LENGTH=289 /DNA_ID=CAMNT_0022724977 /DNA_START=184 /DNA_END=1054 /DNA_ORIENTATION=-
MQLSQDKSTVASPKFRIHCSDPEHHSIAHVKHSNIVGAQSSGLQYAGTVASVKQNLGIDPECSLLINKTPCDATCHQTLPPPLCRLDLGPRLSLAQRRPGAPWPPPDLAAEWAAPGEVAQPIAEALLVEKVPAGGPLDGVCIIELILAYGALRRLLVIIIVASLCEDLRPVGHGLDFINEAGLRSHRRPGPCLQKAVAVQPEDHGHEARDHEHHRNPYRRLIDQIHLDEGIELSIGLLARLTPATQEEADGDGQRHDETLEASLRAVALGVVALALHNGDEEHDEKPPL